LYRQKPFLDRFVLQGVQPVQKPFQAPSGQVPKGLGLGVGKPRLAEEGEGYLEEGFRMGLYLGPEPGADGGCCFARKLLGHDAFGQHLEGFFPGCHMG